MSLPTIITLDLLFQDTPSVIAAYALPHRKGVALIESGPGSTQENLISQLKKSGYSLEDITDVFLTHIHLDHAGAAGWLAKAGATIHVHPVGAPHMVNPAKLLTSAARIYGENMHRLWGQFLPVPEDRISILADREPVMVQDLEILPLDTPGHANHHMSFIVDGICFSGDIGGVRLGGIPAIRAPMPPPEFHLESWLASLDKLSVQPLTGIAPTHFGIIKDPAWHLAALRQRLFEAEIWMEANLTRSDQVDELRGKFLAWSDHLDTVDMLNERIKAAYELANPAFMSFDGILRYWKKFR
jgi:glyoxylase-like metal-dependent hydrolase (beta-lactamase superfamily II)